MQTNNSPQTPAPVAPPAGNARFGYNNYLVRKKVLKLVGGVFHIYDPNGNVAFYTKQKAFKLKEDIRIYTGEDMQVEVLSILARQVIDISPTYDVVDPTSGVKVGALKRKGMKSILRDEWHILDAYDQQIGVIEEDSMGLAMLRRFLTNLVPQEFTGTVGGMPVCSFKQHFNPFVTKINLDFSMDMAGALDRRLGVAAAVLLCAIEGRQQ